MFKFGSTGIVTGYIKQMLATFQLPKALIYTKAHEEFFEKHGYESPYLLETVTDGIYATSKDETILSDQYQVTTISHVPYIKDGRIQFYTCGYYTGKEDEGEYFKFVPGRWQSVPLSLSQAPGGAWQLYERGEFLSNLSKTFQIKNNMYDSYTHEYLGDYLRFIRDYDGINLMPLYNCFSNSRLTLAHPFISESSDIILDTSDSNFKIYSLPVKLFQNYTIAIDSEFPVELCCGFCNKNLLSLTSDELINKTFRKINSSQFGQPFLYTALTELAVPKISDRSTSAELGQHKSKREFLASIAQELSNLRLFIKVSKNTNSSIVVLEGDYCSWNDFAVAKDDYGIIKKNNHTIIANESVFSNVPLNLISPLQLLKMNTGVQMPFSDRLLEYLLDQCVTGGDAEVRENVLMAQHLAGLRHQGQTRTASGTNIRPTGLSYNLSSGVWSDALRRIFYQHMSTRPDFSQTPDILGYVDKDVEKLFDAIVTDKNGRRVKKTMLDFNAWEDINDE